MNFGRLGTGRNRNRTEPVWPVTGQTGPVPTGLVNLGSCSLYACPAFFFSASSSLVCCPGHAAGCHGCCPHPPSCGETKAKPCLFWWDQAPLRSGGHRARSGRAIHLSLDQVRIVDSDWMWMQSDPDITSYHILIRIRIRIRIWILSNTNTKWIIWIWIQIWISYWFQT